MNQQCIMYAKRIDRSPNFQAPIRNEEWGEPTVTIDKATPNTVLLSREAQAEDVSADIYFRWDSENLYIGMRTADDDVRGSLSCACGDGLQLRVSAGEEMGAYVDLYVTVNEKTLGPLAGWNQDQDIPLYKNNLIIENGIINIMAELPLELLGLDYELGDIHDGTKLSFNLLRVSATSYHHYAGWLSFGAFFGIGSEFHPDITESNLLIFTDPDKLGDAVKRSDADLLQPLDIARASRKNVARRWMKAGKRITAVGGKAYTTFSTRWPICETQFKQGGLMNDFTLQEISGGASREVGCAYLISGDCEINAINDRVYCVGGGSSYDVESLSSVYTTNDFPELALLYVYEYSDDGGVLDGYSEHIPFGASSKSFHKLCATAADGVNGKLFALYSAQLENGGCIEVFSYDMSARTWSDSSEVIMLPAEPQLVYTFIDGSVKAVCAIGNEIFIADRDGYSRLACGELRDVYLDCRGVLNIIYACGDRVLQLKHSTLGAEDAEKPLALGVNAYIKLFERNGELCAVAVDNGTLEKISVLGSDDNGFVSERQSEVRSLKSIAISDDIMIARRDSGSEVTDHLDLIVRGKRGSSMRWYYLSIPVSCCDVAGDGNI